MRQSFTQTIALLRQDIAFRSKYEQKPVSTLGTLKMLLNSGVLCIVLFRFQVFFYQHYLKPIAGLIEYINLILFSVAIDSRARIEGGLVIIHANGIYISQHVVAGRNFLMFHQNSVGYSPFFEEELVTVQQEENEIQNPGKSLRAPMIGNNVILGAGASIYGPITVGDGCKIAVNSAVDTSCPANSVMFGVPARQVSKT
jgi:serine O-acetyltransferase